MKELTEDQRKEALKDLEVYYGKPPYDLDQIKSRLTSGLFEAQALAKYGRTPFELIHEVSKIYLTKQQKEEAYKNFITYFGPPPCSEETFNNRRSSGLLDIQIIAKYLMPIEELAKEVGYVVKHK